MQFLMTVYMIADEMTYVNLRLNPERYTGYIGPSARRIWEAIYSENCPKHTSEGSCQEEKILYKLVSGLHSSISVHIASDYLLDEATNLWGQNLTLLYDRVLRYPDRVQNLYFTFLFVLRAVTKVSYLPLYFSVWILGKGSQWSRIVTISFFCMICRQKITWERLNMRLVM
jgi:hypothetical protein